MKEITCDNCNMYYDCAIYDIECLYTMQKEKKMSTSRWNILTFKDKVLEFSYFGFLFFLFCILVSAHAIKKVFSIIIEIINDKAK